MEESKKLTAALADVVGEKYDPYERFHEYRMEWWSNGAYVQSWDQMGEDSSPTSPAYSPSTLGSEYNTPMP